MNVIKAFLTDSGRIEDLKKDFPLYQGQFQNILLNVFVPTSSLAPSFTSQNADGVVLADYVASTSVQIGSTVVARDGSIKVSKNYYMRYLKTLIIQGVEYALYSRKLPKEFTTYAGLNQNLIANVVNIQQDTEDGKPKVISIITSQTFKYDVMPSSDLDQDEAIEPSELENINAQLNEINEILPTKQDKVDNALETNSKSVVGAINENKGNIDINTGDIDLNRQAIAQNKNDIDYLKQNMAMTEEYIGQLTGTSLPTDAQLTQYVQTHTDPSREPKNGDVIIFILHIEDETDRNYKYYYTANGWTGYEIPAIQDAKNGVSGLIKGTYAAGYAGNTLVDISGGEIINIYVKDSAGVYRNIVEYLNTTTGNINNIVDGTTRVGNALKAVEDELGNNIVNTYLTKAQGATKQYVRDYAMPRIFNDVDFISASGYVNNVPTTPESGIQFTVETNAVGDFQLFELQKTNTADFELSSKNGYSNNIYIAANNDCIVTFRLTTQFKKAGEDWADLNVELTSPIDMTAGQIQKVEFGSPFSYLGEQVITLTDGDLIRQILEVVTQTSSPLTFDVYSNEVYPSIFNLTSQSYTLGQVTQTAGNHIQLGMDGVIEAGRVVFTVQNPESYVEYRTNLREFFIAAHLPVVVPTFQSLDPTLPVAITFGDTTYNLYNYMLGADTPLTIGNLMSVARYDQATGFFFNFKATFFENSDIVGFGIIPPAIIATQLDDIIQDNDTIVSDLSDDGTKLVIHLSASTVNTLSKVLVRPMSAPPTAELVGIGTDNSQRMIELGQGLEIENNTLKITPDAPFVSTEPQTLTEDQKAQARENIGAGSGSFSGSYNDLGNKPTLNTSNTASLDPNANETIQGQMNLHKISKTGALADAVQDAAHQTISADEKQQIADNTMDIADVEAKFNDYLPLTGGKLSGMLETEDVISHGNTTGQNATYSSYRMVGSQAAQTSLPFAVVADNSGNLRTRTLAQLREDIGAYRSITIGDLGLSTPTTLVAAENAIIAQGLTRVILSIANDNYSTFTDTPEPFGGVTIIVPTNPIRMTIMYSVQIGSAMTGTTYFAYPVRSGNTVLNNEWRQDVIRPNMLVNPDFSVDPVGGELTANGAICAGWTKRGSNSKAVLNGNKITITATADGPVFDELLTQYFVGLKNAEAYVGKWITFSIDVENLSAANQIGLNISCRRSVSDQINYVNKVITITENHREQCSVLVPAETQDIRISVYGYNAQTGTTVTISKPKLEVGRYPSEYIPANPEEEMWKCADKVALYQTSDVVVSIHTAGVGNFEAVNSTDSYNAAPSSIKSFQALLRDKNRQYLGGLRVYHNPNGTIQAQLMARSQGTNYQAYALFEASANAASATAPNIWRFIPNGTGFVDLGTERNRWANAYANHFRTYGNMYVKSEGQDITTPGTNYSYIFTDYLDKNNGRLGVIGSVVQPDGWYGVYMQCGNINSLRLLMKGSESKLVFGSWAISQNSAGSLVFS